MQTLDPQLVEAFRGCAVANISDNLSRAPGAVGIRPHYAGGTMVGCALTVRTRSGDNAVIHQALEKVRPGDVIVVDGGGDTSRALIGGIMVAIAQYKRAAGYVIDGAIRDIDEIQADEFPVFARSVIHRGPFKYGPGEINVPVTVGGMLVNPGDFVVGDADGVVAFSPDIAQDLLLATKAQEAKEAEILLSITEGRYTGEYGAK